MSHAPARPHGADPGTSGPNLDSRLDQCLNKYDAHQDAQQNRSCAELQHSFDEYVKVLCWRCRDKKPLACVPNSAQCNKISGTLNHLKLSLKLPASHCTPTPYMIPPLGPAHFATLSVVHLGMMGNFPAQLCTVT